MQWFATALLAVGGLPLAARGQAAYEAEPIHYNTARATDPIAKLQAKLDAGETKLDYEPGRGYLASVLRKLHIPASSQTLVFTKTSFQRNEISPQTPRALYFDDEVYVGWVHNGEQLEFASTDPDLGAVFYTLDQRKADSPKFIRQTDKCTQCHAGTMTGDVPGLMVRSVQSDPYGQPVLTAGTSLITQNSPMEDRWGGWYVTGSHGELRHKGNVTAKDRDDAAPMDVASGANVDSLVDRFDATPYLAGAHSDIVAHLVLAHQAEAHNLFTRLNYQARWAVRDSKAINAALGGNGAGSPDGLTDSARRRITSAGEKLVRYLLYCDEELLTDRITGTTTFAADFASRGPRDKQGRSLRDFDLRKRMFRYPLSYLIYSPSFDHLPAEAKDYVYRRLWEVLSGQDKSTPFKHLSTADRQAVLEILRDTKADLPAYFARQP